MNINKFMGQLSKISKKAFKLNDLSIAIKAIESQVKLLAEYGRNLTLDVETMDESQVNNLIKSTRKVLKNIREKL